jgi:hypothetical protein
LKPQNLLTMSRITLPRFMRWFVSLPASVKENDKVKPKVIRPTWVTRAKYEHQLLYMASSAHDLKGFFRRVGNLGIRTTEYGVEQGAYGLHQIDECLRTTGLHEPTPNTSYVAESYRAIVFHLPSVKEKEATFRQVCRAHGFPILWK